MTNKIKLFDTPGISFRHGLSTESTAKLVFCNLIKAELFDDEQLVNYGVGFLGLDLAKFQFVFSKVKISENANQQIEKTSALVLAVKSAYFSGTKTDEFMNW